MSKRQTKRMMSRAQLNSLTADPNCKPSFAQRLKNAYFSTQVQDFISMSSDVLGHLTPFAEHPGVITAAKAAFGVLEIFDRNTSVWLDSFFDDRDKWEDVFSDAISPLVIEECSKFPFDIIKPSDSENSRIRIANVNGVKVGWVVSMFDAQYSSSATGRVFVEAGSYDDVKETLKAAFWRRFGNNPIVLRQRQQSPALRNKVMFEVDDLVDALPSERAQKYVKDFSRAFECGENRSLFMFGPPGSGKSTIARQISKQLDLRSFRLCIEDLGDDTTLLYEIIDLFNPSCIILDDFDRAVDQSSLLEVIAHVRRHVKLIIATANERNKVDEAILRPERFDELEFVGSLDETVVKKLLGDHAEGVYDQVKEWPIVFIKEYVRRRKWLTAEEAKDSLIGLARRVERLSRYKDEDVDGAEMNITSLIKKHINGELRRSIAAQPLAEEPDPGVSDEDDDDFVMGERFDSKNDIEF